MPLVDRDSGLAGESEPASIFEECPPPPFEQVPWALFDVAVFVDNTPHMLFFAGEYDPRRHNATNVYLDGRLPAPQSFLCHQVVIHGLSQSMLDGRFRLMIEDKVYIDGPAFLFSSGRRRVFPLRPSLMIGPSIAFRGELYFPLGAHIGPGLDGCKRTRRPVTVALVGELMRPLL